MFTDDAKNSNLNSYLWHGFESEISCAKEFVMKENFASGLYRFFDFAD